MVLGAHKHIFCAWLQFGDGMLLGEKVEVLNEAPVGGGRGVVGKPVTEVKIMHPHGRSAAGNYTVDQRPDLIGDPWVR